MINLSKIVFLDDETTFRHIFPSSNLPCLPQGDLRKFLRKRRIRLQATYSTVTKILHNYVNLFDKLH